MGRKRVKRDDQPSEAILSHFPEILENERLKKCKEECGELF